MYRTPWSLALVLAGALLAAGCLHRREPAPAGPGFPAPASGKRPPAGKKPATVALPGGRNLLVIERNTNANVVHYDAGLTEDGALNPAEPVLVYWVMLAGDGSRKKLNWLEKKKAYGVKLKAAGDGYTMTLAAAPWMSLALKKAGGVVRLEAPINGRPAVMEKMFIQSRSGLLGPKVEYIDLYGKDLATGKPCRERILPK
jgi:hypothetical protein